MPGVKVIKQEEVGLLLDISQKRQVRYQTIKDFIGEKTVALFAFASAVIVLFIFWFIIKAAGGVLINNGFHFITRTGFDQQVAQAYSATAENPQWHFGVLGLLIGTLTTTLGALFVAVPMGVGTAIVISELAPPWIRYVLQTVVRLLASIPSVIYGLIGLMVVVPFIQSTFTSSDLQIKYINRFQLSGHSMLAGVFVLSIMIVPIIIALAVDAIKAVPLRYKEAGLALGLSHWRTIVRIIVPAAKSGILAGVILAVGRAVGEAIALSMVCGGIGNIPEIRDGGVFFLTPVLTLASAIVNKSELMSIPSVQSALFGCGLVLLITSTILSLCARLVEFVVKRGEGIA